MMMGEKFTEGFYTYDSGGSMNVQYNLGKKYDEVTFAVGHIDGAAGWTRTLIVYVDKEEVKSIPLSYSMLNQTETIEVTGASQLSLEVSGGAGYAAYGVANVRVQSPAGSVVPVSGVDLDMSSVSMKVGEETSLHASVSPANATNKTLTWTSMDTEVATVSQDGLIKAVAEGNTTVTVASNNNVTASCEVTVSAEEHTHTFSDTWKSDSQNHWKECECGEKSESAAHTFIWVTDREATETTTGIRHEECTVCSYKQNEGTVIDKLPETHTHDYRGWESDANAHWKECACGDTIEYAAHDFHWVIDKKATETTTGIRHEECEVCSYKRNEGTVIDKLPETHTHSFSGAWKSDSKNHWKECECGEKSELVSHVFTWVIDKEATETTTGIRHEECEVCSYKRNEGTVIDKLPETHTHSYKGWGCNANIHWKECECGDKIESAYHVFTWVIDKEATETSTGIKHEECEVCSYKRHTGTLIAMLPARHTHSFLSDWKFDAKSHWLECGCGEKLGVTSHSFAWVTDRQATETSTGIKHEECTFCGYRRNENTVIRRKNNTPAKGQKLTDRKSGAVYKVVIAKTKGGTVEYTKPLNRKATNISIPSTVKINGISYKVTGIAANVFKNNRKITKVKIGNHITSIGKNSFDGCSKLKNLTLGSNVVSIGENAFRNCTSLKTVVIPSKVKKIGKQAFYGCKKLKSLRINTRKLNSKNVGSKAFGKLNSLNNVYVPASCRKSYEKLLRKKGLNRK